VWTQGVVYCKKRAQGLERRKSQQSPARSLISAIASALMLPKHYAVYFSVCYKNSNLKKYDAVIKSGNKERRFPCPGRGNCAPANADFWCL